MSCAACRVACWSHREGGGGDPGATAHGWSCCQRCLSPGAGDTTGELIILVTVGSAGAVPGGTVSVSFGKGCEMIDQRWKLLRTLQNRLLLYSVSHIFGSAVLLIELPHACLYMNPECLNRILNASALVSSTDGLREVCDAQALGLKPRRENMLPGVSPVIWKGF